MREPTAIIGLTLATAVSVAGFSSRAQQVQMPLPEIVVTAPKTATPYHPSVSGTMGNTRVEEDRWPQIPCNSSRMNAAEGTCQEGPKVTNAYSYGVGSGCEIAHSLVTAVIGRFAVEADLLVFDPYKVTPAPRGHKCTIWTGYEHLPADFYDMNQVSRRGSGWRNFVRGNGLPGAQSTIEFADGGRNCLALERLGPLWHGGFVWVMHATMCEEGSMPIYQADIDAMAGALRIHTYDPNGNLAPPPRS